VTLEDLLIAFGPRFGFESVAERKSACLLLITFIRLASL
jgi:hypothetical protein